MKRILALAFLTGSLLQAAETVWPLQPLPYDYAALAPHIDARTMEIHYERHHRGYYNNLVQAAVESPALGQLPLETILGQISAWPEAVRNNAGGHYNHALFWSIMSPAGGGEPDGLLAQEIQRSFGSFIEFQEQFNAAARSRFGSGWAWLSIAPDGSLFISSTPNQDNPLMDVVAQRGTPILGLDVWEHAYYLNYQNQRGSYIEAFWKVVNWPEVNRRYRDALK